MAIIAPGRVLVNHGDVRGIEAERLQIREDFLERGEERRRWVVGADVQDLCSTGLGECRPNGVGDGGCVLMGHRCHRQHCTLVIRDNVYRLRNDGLQEFAGIGCA